MGKQRQFDNFPTCAIGLISLIFLLSTTALFSQNQFNQ